MISNWEKTLGLWSTFCNRAASTFHVNCHFSLFLVQNKCAFLVLWTLLSKSRSFSICISIVLLSSEESIGWRYLLSGNKLDKNFAQASWSCLFEKTMATVMLLSWERRAGLGQERESWDRSGSGRAGRQQPAHLTRVTVRLKYFTTSEKNSHCFSHFCD